MTQVIAFLLHMAAIFTQAMSGLSVVLGFLPPKIAMPIMLIVGMIQDLKKDFKDHTSNVFERLNGLNCSAQNVRIENVECKVKVLEEAPEKRRTALVAWGGMVLSGLIAVFEFLKR